MNINKNLWKQSCALRMLLLLIQNIYRVSNIWYVTSLSEFQLSNLFSRKSVYLVCLKNAVKHSSTIFMFAPCINDKHFIIQLNAQYIICR